MNDNRHNAGRGYPQDGFALVIGLLLLIVMSMIGLSMMSTTRLETLMAGGSRESNIAFQAAEAGLRDAEATVAATSSIAIDFDGSTVGQLSIVDAEPDYFDAASWQTSSSQGYSTDDYPEMLPGGQPRYIIKYIGDVIDEPLGQSISVGGYGQRVGRPTVSIFKITARGTSRDASATAILQSHYGRTF